MSASLKIALGANFTGRVWVGLLSFAATPLYLRWLGVEGYGLVGFFLLLQAVTGFFSTAVMDATNREIAAATPGERAAVLAGFARVTWLGSLALGAVVYVASGWIAAEWLGLGDLTVITATRAVRWMAVLIAVQPPLDFYVGCLLGLHRHVAANVVFAGTATLRVVASVAALAWWAPSVEVFFVAQLAASLVMVLVGEWLMWAARRAERRDSVESPWAIVRRSFHFSAGMLTITFTGMLLSQADRLVLSRTLRLDEFGVYSLATTLANLLYFAIAPVRSTFFSEFSRHVGSGAQRDLAESYHAGCLRMAVFVMPAAAIVFFFGGNLIEIWTGRGDLAQRAELIVMLLVAARVIGAINSLPYTLQFAHGWTGLVARANIAAIVLLLPALYWAALRYGAVGAAAGYFALSLPFLVVIVWRMHRRLLQGELGRWVWRDTIPPLALAFVVAGVARYLEPGHLGRLAKLAWIALAGLATLAIVAVASAPLGRWFAPSRRGLVT